MAFSGTRMGMMVVALGTALLGQPAIAPAGEGFMLATGRTTGKSFAVGVGISSLAKVKLMPSHKMDLSAVERRRFRSQCAHVAEQ